VVRPRTAIVVTHPIQHFCPLYRALSATNKINLRVFFASDAGAGIYFDEEFGQAIRFQGNLLDGFDYEFLPGHLKGVSLEGKIGNPHLGERLSAFEPDVVQVYGYYHTISRDAIRWAGERKRPVLFCSDSELRAPRRLWTRAMKALALPRILAKCDGFLTVGDCNEDYFLNYGMSPDRFFRCPLPIDDEMLTKALISRAEARGCIREKFGLPADSMVALVVGKLTTRKSVDHAIRAMAETWRRGLRGRLFLIVAGSGPEKEVLEGLARDLEPDAIRFAGFVEVAELPRYYCAADLLIHPSSQDPHPLAVAEAVFCGLPAIISNRVGSAGPSDDVQLGVNGLEYAYGDTEALARHLLYLGEHPEERRRMSQESLEIGRKRTLSVCVAGYLKALEAVMAKAGAVAEPAPLT
jgi:glycosyltransferase involved in cell wall biosynthesis